MPRPIQLRKATMIKSGGKDVFTYRIGAKALRAIGVEDDDYVAVHHINDFLILQKVNIPELFEEDIQIKRADIKQTYTKRNKGEKT